MKKKSKIRIIQRKKRNSNENEGINKHEIKQNSRIEFLNIQSVKIDILFCFISLTCCCRI